MILMFLSGGYRGLLITGLRVEVGDSQKENHFFIGV